MHFVNIRKVNPNLKESIDWINVSEKTDKNQV